MQRIQNRRNEKSKVSFNTDCASLQHYSLLPFSNLQKLLSSLTVFFILLRNAKKGNKIGVDIVEMAL